MSVENELTNSFSSPRSFRTIGLVFVGAFLASLVVRLWTLGHLSYWLDEVLTVRAIQLGWADLVAERRMNGHFPTYFAMLKLLGLAGASEWTTRLPSAVLSSIAGGLVATIGLKLGRWPLATASGLIYALSPYLISYGMEARPYSLLVLFSTLATGGQLALLSNLPRYRFSLACATLGTLGAIAAIPAGGIAVVAQLIALVICAGSLPATRRRIVAVHVGITVAAIAIGAGFLYTSVADQARTQNGLLKWQASTSLFERLGAFSDAFNFKLVADPFLYQSPLYLFAPIALILSAGVAVLALRRDRHFLYLGIVSIVTPLLFVLLAFFATVASRYLIGMMPAFILMSGAGLVYLVSLPRGRIAAIPLTAALAVALFLQARDVVFAETKFNWRALASFIHQNDLRDVEILSDDPGLEVVMGYYGPAGRNLTYRWINAWPGAMDALWNAGSVHEIAWVLAESGEDPPEKLIRNRVVCVWPFGPLTLHAISRSIDAFPLKLRRCTDPKIALERLQGVGP